MDRFASLNVFRRVVERGSFSAAAKDLNYSNAAVSKMIKELEAELGAQLIVRTTRAMRLTDTGLAYFSQVSELLDGLAAADEAVRSRSGKPSGRLRISAPVSFGLLAITRMLSRFAKLYPEIVIDLALSDSYVDIIEDGFDLALRGGTLDDSSLKARKLYDFERIICASPSYLAERTPPHHPDDLFEHKCLAFSSSPTPNVWHLVSAAVRKSITIKPAHQANNSLAIRQGAVDGLGLAFMPSAYVVDELASGTLVRVLPEWSGEPQALYAVYPAHREASLKHRKIIDFLSSEFANL